jgi:ArsR family transcriptional regulator
MAESIPPCKSSEHLPRKRPGSAEHSTADVERAAELFRTMGDASRLRLLLMLEQGELCVTEIVQTMGEQFSTVSQRLRVLRSEGLVHRRRKGTHVFYALADRHVVDLIWNALAHASELVGGKGD